jgi:chorismate synthase
MPSNRFGNYFTFTTFGESHGPGIGVVIDGCPSGLTVDCDRIQDELKLRKPGKAFTSPRNEEDQLEVLSGLYENKTHGAPLAFFVRNKNHHRQSYDSIKDLLRPGHANFTYQKKYSHYDPYGGGRASARETLARVIAGSIAKQFLETQKIFVMSYVSSIGSFSVNQLLTHYDKEALKRRNLSPFFTLMDQESEIKDLFENLKNEGDSIGGIVHTVTSHLPIGLGDPIYQKLEALLGYAFLSIPGTKGVEFGLGFNSANLKGSFFNDQFLKKNETISLKTNYSGGTLGGISNGEPIDCKVCFKPTSSIKIPQQTFDHLGNEKLLDYGSSARHDPCIAIRGCLVTEAMAAIVLADCLLANRLTNV